MSRDSFGDMSVAGDMRWTGKFGVAADLIALDHCSIEFIKIEDIKVYPGAPAVDWSGLCSTRLGVDDNTWKKL